MLAEAGLLHNPPHPILLVVLAVAVLAVLGKLEALLLLMEQMD